MTTAKELFQVDKRLADWFASIVHQTDFERCLAFADAELINLPMLSAEMLHGAREYKRIIMELSEVDDDKISVFPPQLQHDLNKLPPARQPKTPVKEKSNES